MTINRNNYEEFFLLYIDNELDETLRAEVEDFAAQHPDMQKKLDALLQTKLSSTEEMFFESKGLLYKHENPGLVTLENYETFFLLYTDNELPEEQRAVVESFVANNPEKKQEWIVLQHAKLQSDDSIKFPDKQSLYRKEEKPVRIIPPGWARIAAAAAVIITGGLIWMNVGNKHRMTRIAPQQVAITSPDNTSLQKGSQAVVVPNVQKLTGAEEKNTELNSSLTNQINQKGQKYNASVATITQEQVSEINPVTDSKTLPQEQPVTNIQTPAQSQIKVQAIPEPALAFQEDVKNAPDRLSLPVKPVLLDAAAFSGDRDKRIAEKQETEDSHYLSINNDNKKTKGKLRGLFRRVTRMIDQATSTDPEDEKSIIRIASFEIAKK